MRGSSRTWTPGEQGIWCVGLAPLGSQALGSGFGLQAVVAARVPRLLGTVGGLVCTACRGRMQFSVTPKLSRLGLGLSIEQVSDKRGPGGYQVRCWGLLGSDSPRVMWPGPPFLGVWVALGL